MTAQDSKSNDIRYIVDFILEKQREWILGTGSTTHYAFTKDLIVNELSAYVTTRVKEAEKKGVAWTIGIIDEMHEMDIEKNGGVRDSQYKGIKNGIRAMYEQDTGNGDPAPNYPINVTLTTTTNGKEEK